MAYLRDPDTKKAPPDVLAKRRAWFAALVAEAQDSDAWVISVPGAKEIVIETLPTSGWPAVLAKRGYSLEAIEDGERIIATAIREPMVINADGSLGPLTPGSTRPTTMVVHHTGTVKTRRFTSPAPG
jgi:hypothetical protein